MSGTAAGWNSSDSRRPDDLATRAVIGLTGLIGPLLATPKHWHLPVVLGELLAGIALGPTVLGALRASDPTFTFLADMGFALIMFAAGSHVPAGNVLLYKAFPDWPAALVAVVAVVLGTVLAAVFGTGPPALYAVLIASSSAALILPVVQSLRLAGPAVVELIAQVAIADMACIVALPLAIDPPHAVRAGLGALAVIACASVVFLVLRRLERDGVRRRLHRLSDQRKFALELRISLTILFALAAVAVRLHVSIMLAGFSFGLATAAIGQPRRLARQLFAAADGFFGPLFFVWLGASINLRDLQQHPSYVVLGAALGLGAAGAHLVARFLGQPLAIGALAGAQLGVPVAAATIGTKLGSLRPGEAAALLLGARTTIAVAVAGGSATARSGLAVPNPRADPKREH